MVSVSFPVINHNDYPAAGYTLSLPLPPNKWLHIYNLSSLHIYHLAMLKMGAGHARLPDPLDVASGLLHDTPEISSRKRARALWSSSPLPIARIASIFAATWAEAESGTEYSFPA